MGEEAAGSSGCEAGNTQAFSRPGQPPVGRDEIGPETLGEGYIGGVIGRQHVSKLETSVDKSLVAVADQGQVQVVLEGFLGPPCRIQIPTQAAPER